MPQLPEAHRLQHRKAQVLQLCLHHETDVFQIASDFSRIVGVLELVYQS